MRRFCVFLSLLIPAVVIAGCSGNTGSPLAGTPGISSVPAAHSGNGMYNAGRLFHFRHTPPGPPPRRHKITAADRARALAGGWTPVTNKAPWTNGADTELLMTDGTVIVHDYCTSNWYALAPDSTGSYINGTWTKTASMPSNYGPLYFGSAVLADGKLIVNGGEYNFCNQDETNLGAIYDPFANKWTAVTGPQGWGQIGDASSVVLSDGTYMLGNCCTSNQALLNESSMTWTQVGTGKHDTNSEEGWTLLPSGKVVTADVFSAPASELYDPSSKSWSSAGNLPLNIVTGFEIGPQTLRPNKTVFVAGATGQNVVYTASGTWVKTANFPKIASQQYDVADGPSTLMTSGSILIAASPGLYAAPTQFFIFNGKSLKTIANPPNAPNDSSYNVRTIILPTGQVMVCDDSADVEIYGGSRKVIHSIAPMITSVPSTITHGSTYTVTGKRFNGASQANMYGDDVQQATNYPLVRIVASNGHVYYARTHGHSSMAVGSNATVTTMFDVPSSIATGAAILSVVTNGIDSTPVSVTIN
jgi:hypothetical protein